MFGVVRCDPAPPYDAERPARSLEAPADERTLEHEEHLVVVRWTSGWRRIRDRHLGRPRPRGISYPQDRPDFADKPGKCDAEAARPGLPFLVAIGVKRYLIPHDRRCLRRREGRHPFDLAGRYEIMRFTRRVADRNRRADGDDPPRLAERPLQHYLQTIVDDGQRAGQGGLAVGCRRCRQLPTIWWRRCSAPPVLGEPTIGFRRGNAFIR